MTRWIGSNGIVENTGAKDLTGTSYNERSKTRIKNLDDMIHYLEYAKYSGEQAARVDVEQEEYWAKLLRHLLVEKIIQIDSLIRDDSGILVGMTFNCLKCNWHSKIERGIEFYDIESQCVCGNIKSRCDDIREYLVDIIEKYNENRELQELEAQSHD